MRRLPVLGAFLSLFAATAALFIPERPAPRRAYAGSNKIRSGGRGTSQGPGKRGIVRGLHQRPYWGRKLNGGI